MYSLSVSNITKCSCLNAVAKYMNRQYIVKSISSSFPTEGHNATKFGVNQDLMAITLGSISGISRICRIAAFKGDGLVRVLLGLDIAINENAISATLKNLGQSGAHKLQTLLLSKNARWVRENGLESITLDADSTVKSVCGNKEGAAKGFNATKKVRNYEDQSRSVWARYILLAQKRKIRGHFVPKKQGIRIFLTGVKLNLPTVRQVGYDNLSFGGNSFCLIAGIKTGSKNSIWIFK